MASDLKQTFTGRHTRSIKLTGSGSAKDTRHHEIAIDGAPVSYLPGDALGVHPHNSPALVERVVAALGARGDEPVSDGAGGTMPLAQALTECYSLANPSRRLLDLCVSRGAADLAPLLDKANAEQLKHYLTGWDDAHDVLDVLEMHPSVSMTPVEFVDTRNNRRRGEQWLKPVQVVKAGRPFGRPFPSPFAWP